MTPRKVFCRLALCRVFLCVLAVCGSDDSIARDVSPGVAIVQEGMDALHDELAAHITGAAAGVTSRPGLVGALGGAHVKLLTTGTHQIRLPLPQLGT